VLHRKHITARQRRHRTASRGAMLVVVVNGRWVIKRSLIPFRLPTFIALMTAGRRSRLRVNLGSPSFVAERQPWGAKNGSECWTGRT
jgi:hypothetical protein